MVVVLAIVAIDFVIVVSFCIVVAMVAVLCTHISRSV